MAPLQHYGLGLWPQAEPVHHQSTNFLNPHGPGCEENGEPATNALKPFICLAVEGTTASVEKGLELARTCPVLTHPSACSQYFS